MNDNTIIITGYPGVVSHDNGATWSTINAENQMINLKFGNGRYYATGLGRAYISVSQ